MYSYKNPNILLHQIRCGTGDKRGRFLTSAKFVYSVDDLKKCIAEADDALCIVRGSTTGALLQPRMPSQHDDLDDWRRHRQELHSGPPPQDITGASGTPTLSVASMPQYERAFRSFVFAQP
jgi:hypothetical protein